MCPQRESNPHLFLRTELLYPLSYEGLLYVEPCLPCLPAGRRQAGMRAEPLST